jgi:hypothetical protein
VDLVLSGHDHIYERGDAGGTKYLVSGGGGAPVYKLGPPTPTTRKAESSYHFVEVTTTANDLRVVAHRAEGSIIERCGFAKDKPWDCDTVPPAPRPAAAATQSPADPPAPPKSTSRCSVGAAGAPGARGAHGLAALVFPGILAAILGAALARRRRG